MLATARSLRVHLIRALAALVGLGLTALAGLAFFWPSPQYAFFVAGHAYGVPGTKRIGVHPPFRRAFDAINADPHLVYGFLTGDAVHHATAEAFDALDADLGTLRAKVVRIAGNHELQARALYEDRYGKTWRSFEQYGDLFVVLDGTITRWSITGEQLAFLTAALQKAHAYRNVFVFVHQVLWWDPDRAFLRDVRPNSTAGIGNDLNYWPVVHPLLRAVDAPVYVFAGDVGAWPYQRAFQHHTDGNVHLIVSGMGGVTDDNFAMVRVYANGSVEVHKRELPR